MSPEELAAWEKAVLDAAGPADGTVLVSLPRRKKVFLSLGADDGVSKGLVFLLWRNEGRVRQYIAHVRVVEVQRLHCEARVEYLHRKVEVERGMSASSPFYAKGKAVRVLVAGSLRYWPREELRRGLASHGVKVVDTLEEKPDLVILCDPPVEERAGGGHEDVERARTEWLADMRTKAERSGAQVVHDEHVCHFVVLTSTETGNARRP